MSARLIQVIETNELRGKGVDGDPVRRVMQYYSPEGVLLAENDPCAVSRTTIPRPAVIPDLPRDNTVLRPPAELP